MPDARMVELVRFLAGLEEARGGGEAEAGRLAALAGFDCYCVFRTRPPLQAPEERVLAARLPAGWMETYRARDYLRIDPVMRHLERAPAGFRFRDALAALRASPDRKRMERVMEEAERFGMADGYAFPVHGRHGLAGGLVLAGGPVELRPVEMRLFETAAGWLFRKLCEPAGPEDADGFAGTDLTRRELEALRLLAEGLTSPEIGGRLGITRHTVDWYMNAIQAKLKARNRSHAVALAFRLGLVS